MRAHSWPGTLSCVMDWSAAAQTEVLLQWSLLVETCSSDTAVVWASTSFQNRSEAVVWTLLGWGKPSSPTLSQWDLRRGKSHHELLLHPCGFLCYLHWSHSCGWSQHRVADWRHDAGSGEETGLCSVVHVHGYTPVMGATTMRGQEVGCWWTSAWRTIISFCSHRWVGGLSSASASSHPHLLSLVFIGKHLSE